MWMNAFLIHSKNLFKGFTCEIGALCKLGGIHTEPLYFGTYKTYLQAVQSSVRLPLAVTAAHSFGTLKMRISIFPKMKKLYVNDFSNT